MLYVLAAITVALALWFGVQAFLRIPPATQAKILKRGAFVLGGAFVLLLAIRGRIDLAFLFGVLLPLISRFRSVPGFGSVGTGAGAPSGGAASEVSTAWLRMQLDHGSGAVNGEVLQGRWRGRMLASLTLDELLDLRSECSHDAQSVGLIEAFLDRTHGAGWRTGEDGEATGESAAGAPADDGKMTEARACAILGVSRDATPEQIREAHRALMKKLHPDHGGSGYLASEINAAKDFLLKSHV